MCEKKPFTKKAAKLAIKLGHNKEMREYFCKECKAWHLTTEWNNKLERVHNA
jgi:uncharacterized protein YlaI